MSLLHKDIWGATRQIAEERMKQIRISIMEMKLFAFG